MTVESKAPANWQVRQKFSKADTEKTRQRSNQHIGIGIEFTVHPFT